MKKVKCLVTDAQEKCKCEWCKNFRLSKELSLKIYVALTIHKAMSEGLIKLKNE